MLNRRNFLMGAGAASFGAGSAFKAIANPADINSGYGYAHSRVEVSRVIPHEGSYKHPDASNSRAPIGMAMVCAIDISGSIKSEQGEYHSQLEALAEALQSDDVRQSIFMPGGPGSLALCVVDFDDTSKLQIPWIDFRDDNPIKFIQISNEIKSIERRDTGGTDHSSALENAALNLQNLPWASDRNAVNVLTDGDTEDVYHVHRWRERLANNYKATTYALVTEGDSYAVRNLKGWTDKNLITPGDTFYQENGRPIPAGFTHKVAEEIQTQGRGQEVARYKDEVRKAMRRQIILQTASLDLESYTRFASLDELDNAENPYDFLQNDTRFAELKQRSILSPFERIMNEPTIVL